MGNVHAIKSQGKEWGKISLQVHLKVGNKCAELTYCRCISSSYRKGSVAMVDG